MDVLTASPLVLYTHRLNAQDFDWAFNDQDGTTSSLLAKHALYGEVLSLLPSTLSQQAERNGWTDKCITEAVADTSHGKRRAAQADAPRVTFVVEHHDTNPPFSDSWVGDITICVDPDAMRAFMNANGITDKETVADCVFEIGERMADLTLRPSGGPAQNVVLAAIKASVTKACRDHDVNPPHGQTVGHDGKSLPSIGNVLASMPFADHETTAPAPRDREEGR